MLELGIKDHFTRDRLVREADYRVAVELYREYTGWTAVHTGERLSTSKLYSRPSERNTCHSNAMRTESWP